MNSHHHILTVLLTGLLIACLLPPIYMYWDAYITPKWYAAGIMVLILVAYLFYRREKFSKDEFKQSVYYSSLIALFFEYGCLLVDVCLHGFASLSVGSCGSFENPGSMAVTVCLLTPSAFMAVRKRHLRLCWVIPLLTLLTVLLAQSRTGLLAMTVMGVLCLCREKRMPQWTRWSFAFVLMIATCAFIVCHKMDSSRGRWFIAQRTWELIEKRPIEGYGRGGFLREYMAWQGRYFTQHSNDVSAPLADEIHHPLNEFLLLGVDYGVWGILFLVSLLALPLILLPKNCVSCWTLPPLIVFCFFSYPLFNPLSWLVLLYAYAELPASPLRRFAVMMGFLLFLGSVSEKLLQDTGLLRSPYRLYNQAYRHYRQGHLTEARTEVMQCRKICSGYNLELLTGDIERHVGHSQQAIKHYETALTMCPSRFAPLQGLYFTYSDLGDTKNLKRTVQRINQKSVKIISPIVTEMKSLK